MPSLRWRPVTLAALCTLLGLQAMRAFFSYLVWDLGETSDPLMLGGMAYALFLLGLVGAPLQRLAGPRGFLLLSLAALAGGRVAQQALAHARVELGLSAVALLGFWWSLLALARRPSAGLPAGPILGLGADLALRSFGLTVDLPWQEGPVPLVVTLALGSAAVALAWSLPEEPPAGPSLAGWSALGALLFFHHALSGNFAQAAAVTGVDYPWVFWLLAAGPVLALLPAGRSGLWAAAGLLGTAALAAALPGAALWLILASAAALRLGVPRAPDTGSPSPDWRAWLAYLLGALIFLSLAFAYYATYAVMVSLPVLAGGLAILLGALARPRRPDLHPAWTAAAAVILLLGAGWRTASWKTLEPRGSAPAELTVMTYNIRHGFDASTQFNLEAVARVVEAERPDVLGLQEVGRGWLVANGSDTVLWLSQRLELPYHFGPAAGLIDGNALLSPYALQAANLRYATTQVVPRGAILARLQTEAGPLSVVVTHLDHPLGATSARLAQIEELLARWPGEPGILMGDLNAQPDQPELRRLTVEGFEDAAAQVGAAQPTFRSSQPRRRIDYVLLRGPLQAVEARVPATLASDHLPVVVRLTVRP